MSLIQKTSCSFIISLLLSFSSFGQSKKPLQVAVNTHYLFSFVFEETFDVQQGNYFEHNHRVGLELEIGRNFGFGFDRLFINSVNSYLGNKSWTAVIYMAKYIFQFPLLERFRFAIIPNYTRSTYAEPLPFGHQDYGLRIFWGIGAEVQYKLADKWLFIAQALPMVHRGDLYYSYTELTLFHLGIKRNLFKRIDPKR